VSALHEMIYGAVRESAERRSERQRDDERAMNALTRQPVGTVAPVAMQVADELPSDPEPMSTYDTDLLSQIVDWGEFWSQDSDEEQWMAEPVIALGRAHAIYAPGGTGKSLFSLWLAAALATGRQGLDGEPLTRRRVLYLDYEMTHADVLERLRSMGYDESCDLSWLSYAILPTLPPADAPEGGKAIARMAQLVDAEMVVLDTFSRAVSGDENDADTVRSFYRWTLLHLKSDGRTFVRIDHAGKDVEKGQRGSSAKNDDVDVVWQMVKADGGFKLTAKKARMGWVSPTIALQQFDTPSLHYKAVGFVAPAGTDRIVADLDDLGVPCDATTRAAAQTLKSAGRGARMELVRAAQKRRGVVTLEGLIGVGTHSGPTPSEGTLGPTRDPQPGNAHLPGTDPLRDPRDPPHFPSGSRGPLPSGDPDPGRHSATPPTTIIGGVEAPLW
jgi:hypothetical protein